MECAAHKISDTFQTVRQFSFDQKRESILTENRINALLDAILKVRNRLRDTTEKVNSVVDKIEKITWFNNVDNDSLMLINDLISSIRDLHSSLIKNYVSYNNAFRKDAIVNEDLNAFKSAIDDLKESANDLESTFFFLPNVPGFNDTTQGLSLLQ